MYSISFYEDARGNSPVKQFLTKLNQQQQLAELCGMKQIAIGRIESGSGNIPKIETLQIIAKALGMKLLIDLVEDE